MYLEDIDIEKALVLLAKNWMGEGLALDDLQHGACLMLSRGISWMSGKESLTISSFSFEERYELLRGLFPVLLKDPKYEASIRKLVDIPSNNSSPRGPVKILLLTASPIYRQRLRADEEFRDIAETIRLASSRDHFVIVEKYAARLKDFTESLLEVKPHILHFGGHGMNGAVILEDGYIRCRDLAELVRLVEGIELVVLNACYTASEAKAIADVGPAVIANPHAVEDQAAINFGFCFYQALAREKSLQAAFGLALVGLRIRGWDPGKEPNLIAGKTVKPAVASFCP